MVLLVALAVTAAAGALSSRAAKADAHRFANDSPVVYGYAYANRCPAAGIADIVDRWEMDVCNCTSYVAWALEVNGQRTDWFIPGAMNAWNWPHVAQLAGLQVVHAPAVGAVAVWPKLNSPFGHVAYVTSVEADGSFSVGEYNSPTPFGRNSFGFDVRSGLRRVGALFILVPPRGAHEDKPGSLG